MTRLVALFLLMVSALMAHHSIATEFDISKPAEYRATITRVQWMNPHVLAFATVDGREVAFEIGAPNSMTRRGWTKDLFKEGEVLTILGYPAKDGSAKVNIRRITWADGRSMEHIDSWNMTAEQRKEMKP
jgi:hypothetical protein